MKPLPGLSLFLFILLTSVPARAQPMWTRVTDYAATVNARTQNARPGQEAAADAAFRERWSKRLDLAMQPKKKASEKVTGNVVTCETLRRHGGQKTEAQSRLQISVSIQSPPTNWKGPPDWRRGVGEVDKLRVYAYLCEIRGAALERLAAFMYPAQGPTTVVYRGAPPPGRLPPEIWRDFVPWSPSNHSEREIDWETLGNLAPEGHGGKVVVTTKGHKSWSRVVTFEPKDRQGGRIMKRELHFHPDTEELVEIMDLLSRRLGSGKADTNLFMFYEYEKGVAVRLRRAETVSTNARVYRLAPSVLPDYAGAVGLTWDDQSPLRQPSIEKKLTQACASERARAVRKKARTAGKRPRGPAATAQMPLTFTPMPPACVKLADYWRDFKESYWTGRGVARSFRKGVAFLIHECDTGRASACSSLAHQYQTRENPEGEESGAKADEAGVKACLAGDPGHCEVAGRQMITSRDAQQHDRGLAFLRLACTANPTSCSSLFDYLEKHEPEAPTTLAAFEKHCGQMIARDGAATNAHVPRSCEAAGLRYLEGRGGARQDEALARKYLTAACVHVKPGPKACAAALSRKWLGPWVAFEHYPSSMITTDRDRIPRQPVFILEAERKLKPTRMMNGTIHPEIVQTVLPEGRKLIIYKAPRFNPRLPLRRELTFGKSGRLLGIKDLRYCTHTNLWEYWLCWKGTWDLTVPERPVLTEGLMRIDQL